MSSDAQDLEGRTRMVEMSEALAEGALGGVYDRAVLVACGHQGFNVLWGGEVDNFGVLGLLDNAKIKITELTLNGRIK